MRTDHLFCLLKWGDETGNGTNIICLQTPQQFSFADLHSGRKLGITLNGEKKEKVHMQQTSIHI